MKGYAKSFFVVGCLNLAVAIALGAAGAHALKPHLASMDPGGWFATAVQYHQLHSLGLIVAGLALALFPGSRGFVWAGGLMIAGVVLFCGGLYALSLAGVRLISGGIPAGGVAFILAWVAMAIGGLRVPAKLGAS